MSIGIDIAKKTFEVTVLVGESGQEHKSFANTEKGFKALDKWLKKLGAAGGHVCMEATNVYWEELAEYLHAAGYRVSVVNPVRLAGYARSQMRRNKTDKVDSEVAAAFCATQSPELWQPPNETQKQLRRLERHRADLQQTLTQTKNRLATAKEPLVRQSLGRLSESVKGEIAQIDEQLDALVAQSPELSEQLSLLTSLKSVGKRTALQLMAEMYDLAHYTDASAAAADAGLTPAKHESGESVRRKVKLGKVGKAAVRGALYLPALNAMRHNPLLRTFAQRLRKKGKPEMVIICAVMRKLLHIAYGILKHRTPFDPNFRRPALLAS
jgi:transposase